MTQDRIAQVAGRFDAVAPTYDQVGVDFFGPVARHLVGLLDPQPGEQVIELDELTADLPQVARHADERRRADVRARGGSS